MGEVEGEVEEEKSGFELDPNDPHEAEGLPVGVEGSSSSSSSSFQEGMSILADDEGKGLDEGEVDEVAFWEEEVGRSSSESTSLNSWEKDASFHSRAARASELLSEEE